jgi:Ca2+-binding EF-hand superfamily protein
LVFYAGALSDLDKRIIEAFVVFDHASSNTVDVREVGTIIRSLGEYIFYSRALQLQCTIIIKSKGLKYTTYLCRSKFLMTMEVIYFIFLFGQ